MSNKFDLRQSIYRGTLNQIGNQTNPEGDNLLNAINNQLTPLLRMSANSPASLVVNVGGGDLTDSETNRRRAIPHVGTAYVQFTSGTVTFPATSGGNITCSPGTVTPITVGVGNYAAVLIYLDGSGNLNALPGTDSAVLNTAITNLPPSPDETLPLGFIVVQNVAGTIQNITQANIAQFGTGAGGGGSGNVTAVEAALRDYNNFAQTKYLDPNIFRQTKTTKVDGASTGAFDLVKNAFKFTSVGQTFVSTNLANAEFLAEGVDIADAHLYVHWLLGFIDPSATYEVSRDGGTNWQSVTMSRVGTASNAWRGYKLFTDESVQQNLQTVAATGAGDTLNATTNQELSSQLVLSTTSVVRSLDLLLNRASSASVGNLYVQIVKNNAGVPSTAIADIVAESAAINIASLSTGDITVAVDMPDTVLTAGTYHVVLRTDAAYKAGTMNLSWRSGAGTNGATYNGTSWTGSASTKAATVKGRAHDLRVRITSATGNTFLEGIGVYFPSDDGMVRPNGTKNVQKFYFSGDENRTSFQLNWTPDPDLLDIIDPYRGQIYSIEPGVAQIQGNTIVFAAGTFDFPGEDIVLVFRQVKGVAIDNSDANAAKNSEQDQNLLDVGSQIEELDFVSIPKISVPFTQIVNRAQIIDLSQDLNARMGVNRLVLHQLARVHNEFGPNGEPVFRVVNDRFDQLRLVGSVWVQGSNQLAGQANDSYLEVVFYGTGVNTLHQLVAATGEMRVSVDGGAEVPVALPNSSVIGSRGYPTNQPITVASNLTPGLHTVRVRLNSAGVHNLNLNGIEILNETTNIRVRPGLQLVKGKARTLSVESAQAFNSGFELGTLGTRGGRVVVYQKADGTIAKAVTPTDATQLNLSSANHANEEVVRVYNFREFGANRADDFSTLAGTASNRAFTLNDGTTTLVAQNHSVISLGTREAVAATASGDFLTFTFVGTGLDIINSRGAANTMPYTVSVDGTAIITATAFGGSGLNNIVKIVSGLPYGTHTVRIASTGAGTTVAVSDFIVYQPKTPSIPTGAKAIAAYNLMANFAANATAGADTVATGVLRKSNSRELVYVNGTGGSTDWNIPLAVNEPGGFRNGSDRLNSYFEYIFFGTGFEMRTSAQSDRASNVQVSLQSLSTGGSLQNLTTTNFPSIITSAYGTGVAFNNATGIFDQQDAATTLGVGMRVSGLPLGLYRVRFNNGTAGQFLTVNTFDVITPIHSPKSNLYSSAQNTLTIGSQAIEDLRKIKALEQVTDRKILAQAFGITSDPTTTSGSLVPCPDMSVTITLSEPKNVIISYSGVFLASAINIGAGTSVYVNGTPPNGIANIRVAQAYAASTRLMLSDRVSVPLSAGTHKIDVYWYAPFGGTITAGVTYRSLLVEEE